jgi:hypothetical protein
MVTPIHQNIEAELHQDLEIMIQNVEVV